MFIAMSHLSGSKLLRHHRWTLTETALGYAAVVESWRSACSVPQDQSLHDLQRVIDGVNVRVGQPKALDVALGGS